MSNELFQQFPVFFTQPNCFPAEDPNTYVRLPFTPDAGSDARDHLPHWNMTNPSFHPYLARSLPVGQPHPWPHGTTRQIDIEPVGAVYPRDPFLFRVSTATIDLPKPPDPPDLPIHFRPLEDYDRRLLLLEGGMTLEHGPHGRDLLTQPLVDQAIFSGGWPTICRLHGAPAVDFNVMARRGKAATGSLESIEPKGKVVPFSLTCDVYFFYAFRGGFGISLSTGRRFVRQGEAIRLDGQQGRGATAVSELFGTSREAIIIGAGIFLIG